MINIIYDLINEKYENGNITKEERNFLTEILQERVNESDDKVITESATERRLLVAKAESATKIRTKGKLAKAKMDRAKRELDKDPGNSKKISDLQNYENEYIAIRNEFMDKINEIKKLNSSLSDELSSYNSKELFETDIDIVSIVRSTKDETTAAFTDTIKSNNKVKEHRKNQSDLKDERKNVENKFGNILRKIKLFAKGVSATSDAGKEKKNRKENFEITKQHVIDRLRKTTEEQIERETRNVQNRHDKIRISDEYNSFMNKKIDRIKSCKSLLELKKVLKDFNISTMTESVIDDTISREMILIDIYESCIDGSISEEEKNVCLSLMNEIDRQ